MMTPNHNELDLGSTKFEHDDSPLSPGLTTIDIQNEEFSPFRPQLLSDFVGQQSVVSHIAISVKAAVERLEALDHVLFYGPPGLGKTTLAKIIAQEMSSNIRCISGPMLSKPCDLAAILTNINKHDVLFIDEIHRLTAQTEEFLYSAMEDYAIDVIIGEGSTARMLRITLPHFTLVGATTRLGLLTNPLKDRFGIQIKVDFYSLEELIQIVTNLQKKLNVEITTEAVKIIASRSRGTPRIAIRLTRRARDFATAMGKKLIDVEVAEQTMKALQVYSLGLDILDRKYLAFIRDHYYDDAVGIETIAAGLSEDRSTVEDVVEPYLMQIGVVVRTSRGRRLTERGKELIDELNNDLIV